MQTHTHTQDGLTIDFTTIRVAELGVNIRIDAEAFQKTAIEFMEKINNKKDILKPLKRICVSCNNRRVPIEKSKRNEGDYPYYGASGIAGYIDEYIFDGNYLLVAEDGDNLRSRKKPIAFSVNGKFWVNNHAHILKFESQSVQKIVEIFLNLMPLVRYVSGVAQPKLSKENLFRIKIPIPTDELLEKIESTITAAYAKKEEAEMLYDSAEKILLEELGLLNYAPQKVQIDLNKENTVEVEEFMNIKTAKEVRVADRLDAEYYLPEYEDIENKVEAYKGGFTEFGKLIRHMNKGKLMEYSEEETEDSLPYVLIDNLRGSEYHCFTEQKNGVHCNEDDILIVGDGSKSGEVGTDVEGYVGSTLYSMRLRQEMLNKYTLLNILKMYFKKLNDLKTGSGVPHLDKRVLIALKIPFLDKSIQRVISDNVKHSKQLKQESKKLLKKAKQAVEIFIEGDEEVAKVFLSSPQH